MNLYEKIGRLIKHNKIFDLSDNSNNDSKQNETILGLDLEHFETILSEILSPIKSYIFRISYSFQNLFEHFGISFAFCFFNYYVKNDLE